MSEYTFRSNNITLFPQLFLIMARMRVSAILLALVVLLATVGFVSAKKGPLVTNKGKCLARWNYVKLGIHLEASLL